MHQLSCSILTNTSEEKMCISKHVFIIAFILIIMYISHIHSGIINSLLFSLSLFPVNNKTLYSSPYIFSCSKSLHCVYDSQNLLKKWAIFIKYTIKCIYYIISIHDMVVKSLSPFPLQILFLDIYNYSVKLTSSTMKFWLEKKWYIKIYFQQEQAGLSSTQWLNTELLFVNEQWYSECSRLSFL